MVELFVPGRLCLFGEHSDWAGALRASDPSIAAGACIISGTDQGISATARDADAFEMTSIASDGTDLFHCAMEENALRRAAASDPFFRYAAGVAAEACARYGARGARIDVTDADLPMARGLSSSAAICVLTARALNQVHELGLDIAGEMDLAYRGEIAAGSQCGRMDQACAHGKRLLLLRFDGAHMAVELLRPRREIHILIVDLMHEKDTRLILSELNRHFASPESPHRARLRHALGAANAALVSEGVSALEEGDAKSVGALMTEAQRRFDADVAPACRSELAAPRLHALLADASVRSLTWGGKGVGSQGDGAAQLVCRGTAERDELAAHLTSRNGFRCLPLTIRPTV
jgi:mevalonate kinase